MTEKMFPDSYARSALKRGFEFTLKYLGIELAAFFAALGGGAITLAISSHRLLENVLSGGSTGVRQSLNPQHIKRLSGLI